MNIKEKVAKRLVRKKRIRKKISEIGRASCRERV